jgi:SAM-dependent methyltransferase
MATETSTAVVSRLVKPAARRVVPARWRARVRQEGRGLVRVPGVGRVDMGALRRLTPVSRENGYERGTPVDRYYIDDFLRRNADAIRGAVLDVYDDDNSRRFGSELVSSVDVLHRTPGHAGATIVADLTDAPVIADGSFDCILLTQTLHLVYDMRAALQTVHRILRPGGVALITVPTVSQLCVDPEDEWEDCWRLTGSAARRLIEEVFPPSCVHSETHGNVLSAISFLHGLAAEELTAGELDHVDPLFPVLVGIRAEKPSLAGRSSARTRA